MSCSAGPSASRLTLASTTSCDAAPSRLIPRSLTCRTPLTLASPVLSRSTAFRSAAVSLPLVRAMMTGTGVCPGRWNGMASRAACVLGVPAGRRLALLALATLVNDGNNRPARTVAAIQAPTIAQRKRTANRPVAVKNRAIRNSPVSRATWRV